MAEPESARLLFKLARKKNWGARYDRLEHFRRFSNLTGMITKFSQLDWIIIHKKDRFTGISLNPKRKKEIIEFISKELPDFRDMVK